MTSMVSHLIAEVLALEVRLYACQARLAVSTDSEALHDLRTTVRRLRSLLRPLRGIRGVDELEDAAREIGRLTTPLRDQQVLCGVLHDNGWHALALPREEYLDDACPRVASSPQLKRLFERLGKFPEQLREQQRAGLVRGLRRSIEKVMDKQWRKLRDAIADPEHDRHHLRLLIKRVRYAAEVYPELSHQPKGMSKRLKDAQGALGDWHDHLQWLALADQHADLTPCVELWQTGITRAERKGEAALQRLTKACFPE